MNRALPWVWMVLATAIAWPAEAKATKGSGDPVSYTIAAGETHVGDLYLGCGKIRIAGTLEGDLYAFTQSLEVSGKVTGDINAWAQTVVLDGEVGDSVRVFAQSLTVSGLIDGELRAYGQSIKIKKGAHITGDVKTGGADIDFDGRVDGHLEATGGEIDLRGEVGGDATLKADIINVDPGARVHGDLDYTSRNRLDLEGKEVVGGSVEYTPEKKKPPVSSRGVGKWFFWMVTALIVGLAAVALFRRRTDDIVATVGADGLRSAGIGFMTAIVVPVALCIVCILIITIPLVIIAFLLFAVVIYLAKLPVAVWLGNAVLRRLGRTALSPFQGLMVGVPLLYLLFAVPVLGKLAWFAALFVGLGAIVLAGWTARQARLANAGPAFPGPPGAVPSVPGPPAPSAT